MPQVLAQGGKVLEIGSAVGFLAAHCASVRDDLRIVLQEDNAGLRQMLLAVCAISERTFNNDFRLTDQTLGQDVVQGALAMIAAERPDALLLTDPRLTPAVLTSLLQAVPTPAPGQIFLYGRLLEQCYPRINEITALLAALGYTPDYGFDPNVARGFRLGDADDSDTPT